MSGSVKKLAWDDFRLIKAVADARSLPEAAIRLGLDHSTVFRRLRQIEETLGVMLFERHRTGYVLTRPGEEIEALAQRVDTDITAVMRKLAGQTLAPSGEVRVTTSDTLLVHLLTPLFARFRAQYSEVRLDVVIGNPALNLSKRDADVAIRATDAPPDTLVGRRVALIAWALYGQADAFADGSVAFEELRTRNWIALGENMASLHAVRFVQSHIAPERIVYRVNTVLGLAEAIEAGVGLGHLPCFIGDARPGLRRLAPPEAGFATDLWLLTHPDLRHSPRIRAFLDFMATEITGLRDLIEGAAPADAA